MLEMVEDLGSIKPTENSNYKKKCGIFMCSCGNSFKAITAHIKSGHTSSCGCVQKSQTSAFNKNTKRIYPIESDKLYSVWYAMKNRVLNSSYKEYHNYGGRGISICDEWKNDFMSFYNWTKESGYEEGLTLDRTDNNGNYEPSNCRWVTQKVNSNNRRCSKIKDSK